jgi:murein L,D-transpeptidase YcbB/YkuD
MQRNYWIAGGVAMAALAVALGLFMFRDSADRPEATNRAIAIQLQKEPALAGLYNPQAHPLWIDSNGALSRDGRRVQMLLAAAADHGLPAARYQLPPAPAADAGPAALAGYDIAISTVALRYARDMDQGVIRPASLFNDAEREPSEKTLPNELGQAAGAGRAAAFLAGLEPQGDYPKLKAALKIYRTAPEWVPVEDRAALPARLAAEGYLTEPNLAPRDVDAALKQWQTDNGLAPDGKLSKETLAALNISRRLRAEQIAANMERWRWLPRRLPASYIWVNVPSAQLVLIENGQPAMVSRVVVGAPESPTPIFVTMAEALTINPRWHIPKSITENELLPKLANDPGYLEARDIFEEDGRLVQKAGPQNALGRLKFEMPNGYDVYLHDTPSKNAFHSPERAVSHGCVRVQDVRALAIKLTGMSEQELDAQIESLETTRKPLAQKLPVFIQYWTAMPQPSGRIGFRDDVYGRDKKMIGGLEKLAGTSGSVRKL